MMNVPSDGGLLVLDCENTAKGQVPGDTYDMRPHPHKHREVEQRGLWVQRYSRRGSKHDGGTTGSGHAGRKVRNVVRVGSLNDALKLMQYLSNA